MIYNDFMKIKQFKDVLKHQVIKLQQAGYQSYLQENKIFVQLFEENFEVKTQGDFLDLINGIIPKSDIFNNINFNN